MPDLSEHKLALSVDAYCSKTLSWMWLLGTILVLILLFPGINGFPFPSADARYSDLATTHFPNAIFLRQALVEAGQLPLWSPLIYSGYPFFAHPLSGLLYPPGWVALLFPLPMGFNLLVLLHLLWGGWGMAKFLHSLRLSNLVICFGVLAFILMPKLYAHYGAGHLTLVYAVCWLPWLLWSLVAPPRGYPWVSSLFLALTFLADVRWGVYAGISWGVYALFRNWVKLGKPLVITFAKETGKLVVQGITALALAAPLALPLLEFTRLTSRASLQPADFFLYSLPFPRLLSFLFPDFGGFHEWVLYGGVLIFFLVLTSSLVHQRSAEVNFWLAVFFLSLLFALGDSLPGFEWLSALPGIGLLRVPARALFLTQFSMILLACFALHNFHLGLDDRSRRRLFLLIFSLVVLILMLWIGILLIIKKIPANFLWGGGILLSGMGWAFYALKKDTSAWRQRLVYGLLLLCLLDWMMVDRSLFFMKPASQAMTAEKIAQYFSLQAGDFRIYSPSYSLPQQTAAIYGLEFASGVDPLPLQAYAQFMQQASGAPGTGYSVSLPPFASGNPQEDNRDYLPDAELLGLLNVRYILSAFPIDSGFLSEIFVQDGTYVYLNQLARSRAWVDVAGQTASQTASIIQSTPNRLAVQAQGPGRLVISEIIYPGWRAWLDGKPIPIQAYQGLLRSVDLPEGEHLVQFRFLPTSLYLGSIIFFLSVFALAAYTILHHRHSR